MKDTYLAFAIMFLLVTFGSIRFIDDNDYAKDAFTLHVNVDNRKGDSGIDSVRMKYILMDDSGVMGASGSSRLGGGDVAAKYAYSDLTDYDLTAGEYWARIYVYGDDGVRRITHRPIIIE